MSAKKQSDAGGRLFRRRRFAQVPDALIVDREVSDFAVRLWARLDKYAGDDGSAFPSRERLAEDFGVSVPTVQRGMSCLVKTGWISRRQRSATVWDTELNDVPDQLSRIKNDPQKETQLKETQLKGEPQSLTLLRPGRAGARGGAGRRARHRRWWRCRSTACRRWSTPR